MNSLFPISQPQTIEVPFVKVVFGGHEFGLSSKKNSKTGIIGSDFIKSLTVEKYGSGAVNTYTLNLKYVIGDGDDPNFVDLIISKASDRKITFTYGDLSKPEYSYKNEEGIITSVVPQVDYKNNAINYTITATSSTTLSYALKKSFGETTSQPSQEIIKILYNNDYGLLDLLPGMKDKEKVLANKWIPTGDKIVKIESKKDISPIDYILYLVSLMVGQNGCYYSLRIMDSLDDGQPHFEIVSTESKAESKMMTIKVGYPGSIPVFNLEVSENSSTALLVEYRDKIDTKMIKDYSFRGDLISKNYYTSEVKNGNYLTSLRNWWDKMSSYPLTASLTTQGLYLPADIVQSIYLDIYFFGKKYWHSGEYLIMSQSDSISSSGYRTTLSLMRIGE